jgi:PIN domain nuclease of toxin-antitoxin system
VSGGSYLLDSHILLWLDSGHSRIKPQLLKTLEEAEHRYLSAASSWELGLKQASGKLGLHVTFTAMLTLFRLEELPVLIRHGEKAATLPFHHHDPFDRILVAQAMVEGLILVTGDRELHRYGVPLLVV